MSSTLSRREALKAIAIAAGTLAVVRTTIAAPSLPHVNPQDPMAAGVSYHENVATIKASQFPQVKPGDKCANCAQIGGAAGQTWRPCNIFAGQLVNANGWCTAYSRKT